MSTKWGLDHSGKGLFFFLYSIVRLMDLAKLEVFKVALQMTPASVGLAL